jgi:hypothetical protein
MTPVAVISATPTVSRCLSRSTRRSLNHAALPSTTPVGVPVAHRAERVDRDSPTARIEETGCLSGSYVGHFRKEQTVRGGCCVNPPPSSVSESPTEPSLTPRRSTTP